MKKNCNAVIAVCLSLLLTINLTSFQPVIVLAQSSTRIIAFTWFKDEELTDPTGTTSAINLEINRLQVLFPGYTFSSASSMGLSPYEFGYHDFYPGTVIYSNR